MLREKQSISILLHSNQALSFDSYGGLSNASSGLTLSYYGNDFSSLATSALCFISVGGPILYEHLMIVCQARSFRMHPFAICAFGQLVERYEDFLAEL